MCGIAVCMSTYHSCHGVTYSCQQMHLVNVQDSGEAELLEPQYAAASQSDPHTVSINGNGNSLHHATNSRDSKQHFPAYPFFNADSARLYPEWSLPEPVAVPRAVNGALWDSPWLQQQDHHQAKPHQAIPADQSGNAHTVNAPTASASYQHEALPVPTAQLHPSGATAEQQTVQRQNAKQPEAASAHAQPGSMQQSWHPSVSQVTLAQPETFAAAAGEHMAHPSTQPGQAESLQLLAQPQAHANSHLLQHAADSLQGQAPLPSSQQQALIQRQQQAQLSEQSYQQPHLPIQSGEVSRDTHLRHQQPGAGPSDAGQLPSGNSTGAGPLHTGHVTSTWPEAGLSGTGQLPSGASVGAGPTDTGQVPAGLSDGAGPLDTGQVPSGPNVGAYSQRELFLQNMEQAGDMSFEYVLNDGQRHNSIW